MLERIGWWTFDAETQTLVNPVSDQRIRFEGAVDDAGSLLHSRAGGPARLRFSYQDADVRYPVVVIARYADVWWFRLRSRRERPAVAWLVNRPSRLSRGVAPLMRRPHTDPVLWPMAACR